MIKSTKQLENKRVLIVGFGKCATDMAVLAGQHARSCHLVFRQAHWMVPRKIFAGLLPARLLFTRALSVIFPPIPHAPYGRLFRFIHEKFSTLFTMIAAGLSKDIMSIHGTDISNDKIFIPRHSFRNIENISMIPLDFIRLKREGRFIGRLGAIEQIIDETTVRLDSGEELQSRYNYISNRFYSKFSFLFGKRCSNDGFNTQ